MKIHQRIGLVFVLLSIVALISMTHSAITGMIVKDWHWTAVGVIFLCGGLALIYGDK